MTSIRLPEDFMDEVKRHASLNHRSVPKQVEHWAKIGKLAEANPELSYEFISDIVVSLSESEKVPFEFEKELS